MNFNFLIMENLATIEKMQNDILRIIGLIETSKQAKEHFLGIIGVMFGREHADYGLFLNLCKDPRTQAEMLKASENYKYKQHFQMFCHIVLKDYIEQVTNKPYQEATEGPKNNIPEKDILLEHYFKEIERASQHKTRLIEPDKNQFVELRNLERSLMRRIFPHHDAADPINDTEFTAGNYKQLLTVWLMYPKLIFFPDEVQKIIEQCKTGIIKL